MTTTDADQPSLSPEIEKLKKQLHGDRKSKAFIPLAEEYVKAGMLREAALALEDGLKEFPSFITALVALGRVCIQLDEIPRARDVLQEAVKISPDNVLAHRMLARLYSKDQAWEAAGRSCDMVLFGYPKDEEMLALKAEIAQHLGDGAPPPTRGPSSAAALFGAAAEPPPAMTPEPPPAPLAAASSRTRTDASGKVAQLKTLLARIQARRSS